MLTDEQIQTMVEEFFHRTLRKAEDSRARCGQGIVHVLEDYCDPDRDVTDQRLEAYSSILTDMREALAVSKPGDFKPYESAVDELLQENGYHVEHGTDEYRKVCREYLKASIRALEIDQEHARGNYDNEYDRIEKHHLVRPQAGDDSVTATVSPGERRNQTGATIAEVIDEYLHDGTWAPETIYQYQQTFRMFKELFGEDTPIRTLTRRHFQHFRDTLKILPAGMNKNPKYRGKSLAEQIEIAKAGKDKPMSTVNHAKLVTRIATFFNWADAQGHIDKSLARKLVKKKKEEGRRQDEERSPYNAEDLRNLLDSPLYRKPKGYTPAQRWIPVIALYTGMRLREICQLYLDDITTVDGVPCFDINASTEDKSLKTDASKRTVPIHPALLSWGLAEYAERLRNEGEMRLWPELEYNPQRKGYSGAYGAWFGRFNREHITQDHLKSFHSFRHTVVWTLKQNRADKDIVNEIMGHKHNNIDWDRYGGRYMSEIELEVVKLLDYGLDFSQGLQIPV